MRWSIPEKVIERGRDYLKEGRVLSVVPDTEKEVWHAEVMGSMLYMVDLDGSGKEDDRCQCPYWEEHGYCKHTISVELYLREKGLARALKNQKLPAMKDNAISMAALFNQGFTRLKRQHKAVSEQIALEYLIEPISTNPYHQELDILGLSLKVGYANQTRNYIVKNIYDFLQAYQEQSPFAVNRQHQFTLIPEAFDEETQRLLEDLAGIAETYQLIGKTGLQVKGKLDKRYLLVPVQRAHRLLEQMEESGILSVTIGEQTYRHLARITQSPIQVDLNKRGQVFELSIKDPFSRYLSYYHWGFLQEGYVCFDAAQEEIYLAMRQLLKRSENPHIRYQKSELSDLYQFVLPYLRQIAVVTVAEDVQELIAEYPLQAALIFRKMKGQIHAETRFCYGETVYSSNESHQELLENGQEILRDHDRENAILKQLELSGYQPVLNGFAKPLPQGAKLYEFFRYELPAFRKLADVKIGKKLRQLYLDAQRHQPKIEIDEQASWLDIRFDITGIDNQEIDAVLGSLLRNDQFYTTKAGEVLDLDSEVFRQTSQIIEELRQKLAQENGVIRVAKSQGLILQEKFRTADNTSFSAAFEKMVADLNQPENYPAELPDGINASLRPYQVSGYKWLKMLSHYGFGGILADEMGLGKTLQVITYLLSEKKQQGRLKVLVAAPASLVYNWQAELKKFAPELAVSVVSGSKEEREVVVADSQEVVITSYASLRQDQQLHEEQDYDILILDEAQMVKNSATKTAKALRELDIPKRFAVSGTPVENNLEELWSLFQIIMPGFFPNKGKFRELSAEEIAVRIQPFVLRRDKAAVLKDLPDKIETEVFSTLTEEQKTVYLAYLKRMSQEIEGMDSAAFKKNRMSILAGLTRLRQICDDPRLFIDDYEGGSGKLEQVKDLITAAKENGHRILLFSQFTSMLDILESELGELGVETFYLRGSTKAQTRLEMVDAFNSGERDVFLISLKAGGTGLNLTGADTVILYDLWWNPAVEEQAAGRAHRIGQKRVVEIWRMIAEGTIEERMNLLQQEKRELFQKVMQGNDEQAAKLTEEDIRMILQMGE